LAPGKVNLCLFLGGVRELDRRHRLVTVFEAVSLSDELTLEVLPPGAADEVRCPGVEGPNIVASALAGLRERGWRAPPVRVAIEKRIPVAGGMGGGSADAAAALRLARELGGVEERWIAELAIELGADVPAALEPGLALGTGAGEVVERLGPLAEHAFAIVPLPCSLATPDVYREADRLGLARSEDALKRLEASLRAALASGQSAGLPVELIHNDLEPAASSLCPEVARALAALRAAGAAQALVCGSGPTCAGLWWGRGAYARARRAVAALRERFPQASAVEPAGGIGHNWSRR